MATKKTFIEEVDLETLGNKVITDTKMDLSGIKIKYILVHPYISKTCVARCIKPNHELKYFGNFDYLIEFSENVYSGLTDQLKEIVMYHELKHILVKTDNKGNEVFAIADHDVKDFACIIDKYGINWFHDLKAVVSSVNDFQNGESDRIKL